MRSANLVMSATSPAVASTAAGVGEKAIALDLAGYRSMAIEAHLQGATGGTLDVYLQVSYDGGVSWSDYAHFAQLAAGAAAVKLLAKVARDAEKLTIVTIGKDLTPSLAVNTVLGGEWGDRMRLLFTGGAGTSAGALQTVKLFLSE